MNAKHSPVRPKTIVDHVKITSLSDQYSEIVKLRQEVEEAEARAREPVGEAPSLSDAPSTAELREAQLRRS